jgi:hypothetical protein
VHMIFPVGMLDDARCGVHMLTVALIHMLTVALNDAHCCVGMLAVALAEDS